VVYPKEVHVTANDIDTKALLDQIYFALDAKAFGVFQDMLDPSPSANALSAPYASGPIPLGCAEYVR